MRLLLRFEYIEQRHYGMTLMAYTLINVRRFHARAGRCWGLGRQWHLLHLKIHVRIPSLKNGAELPVQRPHASL